MLKLPLQLNCSLRKIRFYQFGDFLRIAVGTAALGRDALLPWMWWRWPGERAAWWILSGHLCLRTGSGGWRLRAGHVSAGAANLCISNVWRSRENFYGPIQISYAAWDAAHGVHHTPTPEFFNWPEATLGNWCFFIVLQITLLCTQGWEPALYSFSVIVLWGVTTSFRSLLIQIPSLPGSLPWLSSGPYQYMLPKE